MGKPTSKGCYRLIAIKAVLIFLLIGCDRKRPDPGSSTSDHLPTVERFECARCHRIQGVAQPEPMLNCTGCHRAVFTDHFKNYPDKTVEHWRDNVRHFRLTPSLAGIDRFRRQWFVEYLQEPHNIRPGLTEQMPRLRISQTDAKRLADELGLNETHENDQENRGNMARGRELFETYSCNECHSFTGTDAPPGPAFDGPSPATQRRAPDLRHARRRMSRNSLDRWLENPRKVKADALMTMVVSNPSDRADLVAYLVDTPLEPPQDKPPVEVPEPVDRKVRWNDVNEAIFHATCRHCHSDGGPALPGEGGAGNTGGFGYDGAGLVLSSYEGVRRGSISADGSRRDLLEPDSSGVAPIVQHLMARHHEVNGSPVDGVLGMPLALPPVTLDNIALLRGWIAQGAKNH